MKPPARKSSRKRTQRDYAGLNSGHEQDPNRYVTSSSLSHGTSINRFKVASHDARKGHQI